MLTRMCCRCKSPIEKGQKVFVETFCVSMAEQKADLSLESVGGELTINSELCEKCMKSQLNRFNDFFGERAAQTEFASLVPKRRRRRKKAAPSEDKEETPKKGGGRPAKKDRAIVKIKDTNKEKTDNTPKKPPPAPKINV